MHLQDIQCNLHTEGYGFELIFLFEKNDYFKNASLRKSFVMTRQNIIEKCEGTEIEWKEGKDVTKKKIKKKQKAKKGQPGKTITKTVEQESFFNFFKTIEMPDETELAEGKKPEKEDDEEEEKKDAGELMDEDYDMGQEFKDQLIPLALEYYLEVIQEDEDDEDDDCGEDEDIDTKNFGKNAKDKKGSDDEDEDDKPGKGSKKKGSKAGKGGEAGQQECKQQ